MSHISFDTYHCLAGFRVKFWVSFKWHKAYLITSFSIWIRSRVFKKIHFEVYMLGSFSFLFDFLASTLYLCYSSRRLDLSLCPVGFLSVCRCAWIYGWFSYSRELILKWLIHYPFVKFIESTVCMLKILGSFSLLIFFFSSIKKSQCSVCDYPSVGWWVFFFYSFAYALSLYLAVLYCISFSINRCQNFICWLT